MATSRRDVITKGALAGIAALVSLPEALFAKPASRPQAPAPPTKKKVVADSLPWLSRSMFEGQLHRVFQINKPGAGWVPTQLIAVTDVPTAQAGGNIGHPECFNVIFQGPLAAALPQSTYSCNNAALGSFTIFLVPGSVGARTRNYVATFNRVKA
jgi:hypothetical protein